MNKLALLTLLLTTGVAAQNETMGDHVGNGGDELRIVFRKARAQVATRLLQIRNCAYPKKTAEKVRRWLKVHREKLAGDILRSPHKWTQDRYHSCAFTHRRAIAPIIFSYRACNQELITQALAQELLVHESVHHFGIDDEDFVDSVAEAVMKADLKIKCSSPDAPLTKKEIVKMFQPGEAQTEWIGNFSLSGEVRKCSSISGCSKWVKTLVRPGSCRAIHTPIKTAGQFRFVIERGELQMEFQGNKQSYCPTGSRKQHDLALRFFCPWKNGHFTCPRGVESWHTGALMGVYFGYFGGDGRVKTAPFYPRNVLLTRRGFIFQTGILGDTQGDYYHQVKGRFAGLLRSP